MYEKMITMVMGNNVTLEQWKEFRTYFESLPHLSLQELQAGVSPEKIQEDKKMRQDFENAARHVASKLSLEDIRQDTLLTLAYVEIHSADDFS